MPVLFVEAGGGSELYKNRAGVHSARTTEGLQVWEGTSPLLWELQERITELSTIVRKDVAEDKKINILLFVCYNCNKPLLQFVTTVKNIYKPHQMPQGTGPCCKLSQ